MDIREKIYSAEEALSIFSRFLRLLNYSTDFEETLALIAVESKTLMQSQSIVLFLIDEHSKDVNYHIAFGNSAQQLQNINIDKL